MRRALWRAVLFLCLALLLTGLSVSAMAEHEGYYQPLEFEGMNLDDPASRWCWDRSRQTSHFFIFWEEGFGADPSSEALDEAMRVDIDDLADKAEALYVQNAVDYHMLLSPSRTDSLKMHIYLLYTSDWVAVGSGYDNMIGALWVSPMACRPVGFVTAHEIGHCFQYQIYGDQLLAGEADDSRHGFRYGYGEGAGNGFWEQCAQWAAMVGYPDELFGADFDPWPDQAHRSFEHEWSRYQGYWLPLYLTQRYGDDAIARLWQESACPEDALHAFMRLYCEGSAEALNDMLYDYAARMATFDLDIAAPQRLNHIGAYHTALYDAGEGWLQVGYGSCPQQGGFNVIEIIPDGRGAVSVELQALEAGSPLAGGDAGVYHQGEDDGGLPRPAGETRTYNPSDVSVGFRWGFVALRADGRCAYGDMGKGSAGGVTFIPPEDTAHLYFVVVGASDDVPVNVWDDDELTDIQMPYKLRVTGGAVTGA